MIDYHNYGVRIIQNDMGLFQHLALASLLVYQYMLIKTGKYET